MKKETKPKHFLPKPEYPGGPKAITAFIYAELKYPNQAFEKKIEGTVVVKAEINYRGEVIGTQVVSGLGHGCDEEAERVIRLLRFHVDKVRNLKVIYFKTFTIQFKMPTPNQTSVNYVLVNNSSDKEKSTKSEVKPSYTITISFKEKK